MLLTACSTASPSQQVSQDHPYTIVTTFPPLYSLTKNIVQEEVEVINLVPAGVSIHTWEPKPADIKALSRADALMMVGLNLEPFIEDMIESAGNPKLQVIQVYQAVESELQSMEEWVELPAGAAAEEDGHEHEHEGLDPHIWLNPQLAVRQVEWISEHLPERVQNNQVDAYKARLIALDQEIQAQLQSANKQPFILFHDAYGYFLKRYQLDAYHVASIEPFPGKEPTLAYLNQLTKLIKEKGVNLVFTEPQFSPKVIEALKSNLDLNTYSIDPIGSELTAEGYEHNLKAIADTLSSAFGK
ncbi:zinc ABC transporter substrate-binding protein [Candidatus Peregrinibacteria bacterium]|nr:MAG: zinc ABC transporter substrate-binding protein [Candidatus Peregrinibacteria bacterium]